MFSSKLTDMIPNNFSKTTIPETRFCLRKCWSKLSWYPPWICYSHPPSTKIFIPKKQKNTKNPNTNRIHNININNNKSRQTFQLQLFFGSNFFADFGPTILTGSFTRQRNVWPKDSARCKPPTVSSPPHFTTTWTSRTFSHCGWIKQRKLQPESCCCCITRTLNQQELIHIQMITCVYMHMCVYIIYMYCMYSNYQN